MKRIFPPLFLILIITNTPLSISAKEIVFNSSAQLNALETSPLMWLYKIYALRYLRAVTKNSDLMIGYAYMNISWENQGEFHSHNLLTGYRYYFWEGLHAEYELWTAHNTLSSSVDGKNYPGIELWHAVRGGYTWYFKNAPVSPYLLAQVEVGTGIARLNNPWPNLKNHISIHPIVLMGTTF